MIQDLLDGYKYVKAMRYQENYEKNVAKAVSFLEDKLQGRKPEFGIVLGSGLGDIADAIKNPAVIDYSEIPYFPTPTVEGHEGKMLIGELEGVEVIGLKGRKHFYEVADEPLNTGILKVVFPIHVLAGLKVPNYFVTCAVGGLNLDYGLGDMMAIESHLITIDNPLRGRHMDFERVDGGKRWRFQPMVCAYNPEYRELLFEAAGDHMHEGKLLTVSGPTYESEAECLVFRDSWKMDAVGMSTSPEVIVARNRGMKAVGMACITNTITKEGWNATNHEEVKAILESDQVRNRLSSTVKNFFSLYREIPQLRP